MIKNLSVAILQLSEAGELSYMRSKWWATGCLANAAKASTEPHGLKGMFLLLALGLGLGVLLAVLELTSKSRSNAGDQRVCGLLLPLIQYTSTSRREVNTLKLIYMHAPLQLHC